MRIQALITKVKEERPNSFTNEKLISFINEIEAEVAEQLGVEAPVYTTDDLNKELLVNSNYDKLYVSYVKAQVAYANEETDNYDNDAAQHVQDFADFNDWVVRTGRKVCNRFPRRFRNVL